MMSKHDSLIRRLKGVTKGSLELSAQIISTLGAFDTVKDADPKLVLEHLKWAYNGHPPTPTESIDDAVLMVPEGFWIDMFMRPGDTSHVYLSYDNNDFYSSGATTALAMCTAILRVNEVEELKETHE